MNWIRGSIVKIRVYQDSDEPAVIDLWQRVLPHSAPHNAPKVTIQKKIESDRDLFFVAELDGAVVGTVMGGYDGHRGWIYTLAVSSEHRHRGIGTRLVQHAESALIERDCVKVNLQVLPTNEGVVAFYENLGYAVEQRISMGKRFLT